MFIHYHAQSILNPQPKNSRKVIEMSSIKDPEDINIEMIDGLRCI